MSRFSDFGQFVESAMKSWHCPGAAVAVIKGDDVLFQGAFGLRDVEAGLPMTVDTRFPMASVTKSFTAMSAALLVDEGKLEWDKPVREYIPEFILRDPYVTEHVTVRDMLSHRTGLPRHDLSAWRLDMSRAEFVRRMKYLKFNASFREKFQYNNLMYYATAYLVETIACHPWEDFVAQRIFAPLGMEASNFTPEPPREGHATAIGYRVDRDDDGRAVGHVSMPFGPHTELSPSAAGALFSTLADLIRWLQVHVNDGRAAGTQLISPDSLKQMHLPHTVIPGSSIREELLGNTIVTYGLGWFVEPYRGYTLVHHGGDVEGHSLIVGFVPGQRVGVVGLTNCAAIPLRDVLLYEGIDRALDLSDRNWNARFHSVFDPMFAGEAKAERTSAQERIEGAPMTHRPEAYVGAYAAKGYPDFAVRYEDERFQACIVGGTDWSELRHYHYDVFEYCVADFDMWIKVRFLTDDAGEIDSVSMPVEPEVENIVFTRKQPDVHPEI